MEEKGERYRDGEKVSHRSDTSMIHAQESVRRKGFTKRLLSCINELLSTSRHMMRLTTGLSDLLTHSNCIDHQQSTSSVYPFYLFPPSSEIRRPAVHLDRALSLVHDFDRLLTSTDGRGIQPRPSTHRFCGYAR